MISVDLILISLVLEFMKAFLFAFRASSVLLKSVSNQGRQHGRLHQKTEEAFLWRSKEGLIAY